jgi:transposase
MDRVFIGLDLHTTQITIHRITVSAEGKAIRTAGQYSMEKLESVFLASLTPECAICLEAGGGSHALARMIVATGARAFVVNPLAMPQIFLSAKKTDHVDAKKLADCLKWHLEGNDPHDGFPEVYVADADTQRLRMLISQYQRLNSEITALKNNLYATFRQWLVHVDKGLVMEELDSYLKHPRLPPEVGIIARQSKHQYDYLLACKEEMRNLIEHIGVLRYPEEVRLLIGLNGVSLFGAACIMSDIITITRFRTHKNLASYLRAAPRVDASNKTVHIGRLNKAGRKMSFEVLLQGVNHLIDGNPFLEAYTKRAIGKPKNKIRATMVARTITQIFYMLKNKEPNRFRNQDNFHRKELELKKQLQQVEAA